MAFRAVPLNISSELLDLLNSIAEHPAEAEQQIQQVEFRAQKLKVSAPREYFMLLGICQSLRRNPAGVRENFESALAAAPPTAATRQNYIIALHEAGDYKAAEQVLMDSKEFVASDPTFLRAIFNSALHIGRLDLCSELEGRMVKMQLVPYGEWGKYLEGLEACGIKHEQVGDLIRTSRDFLTEHGVHRPDASYSFSAEYACPLHLTQTLPSGLPAQETYELELALYARLFEQAELLCGDSDVSPLDAVTITLTTQKTRVEVHA